MEFTSIELTGGAKLANLVEKAVADWPSRAARGRVPPSHGELGRQSTRCVWMRSAQAMVSCTQVSSAPAAANWAASTLAETSAAGRGEHEMSASGGRPGRPP
jgi:predicted short-subunit dehydrogenase-like oxidoreductase (DUF2520 family)